MKARSFPGVHLGIFGEGFLKGVIHVSQRHRRKGGREVQHQWQFSRKYAWRIKTIFYNSRNQAFLLTGKDIYNMQTGEAFLPAQSLNDQLRLPYAFHSKSSYLIDKSDHIWLGYGHGEWGGDIYVFNTVDNTFVTPVLNGFNINLYPILSLTEGPGGIYFSGGLSHLSMTDGYVGKFEGFTGSILLENTYDSWSKDTTSKSDFHYIGPIDYNRWDSSFYMYSHRGFFKVSKNSDVSKIENWQKIIQRCLFLFQNKLSL